MLRARKAQRPSPREVGISKLLDVDDQWFAMLLDAQQLAECGILLSVANGIQAEEAAWEDGSKSANRSRSRSRSRRRPPGRHATSRRRSSRGRSAQ